jgi:hypothetical protein
MNYQITNMNLLSLLIDYWLCMRRFQNPVGFGTGPTLEEKKSLLKSRWLIAAILYALFTKAASAQDRAPGWLLDTESEYPSSRYVAAAGEGKTRAEAEAAALTAVSLFFGTKTEIRKEAIREFNETATNTATGFSKKTYIGESARIKSEEEFLGIRFAPPWLDPQRQTWAVLAYIKRQEAGEIYESRINANMSAINALIEDAEREKEAIYACALLYGGLPIADITEEYIQNAVLVDSGSARKYDAALARIQRLRSGYRALRGGLSFAVTVNGPDTAGRLTRTLRRLLEDNGYVISPENPRYTVTARFTAVEEPGQTRTFIVPGISVRIEGAGSAIFSYAKNYDRVSSRDLTRAYGLAINAVEEDLEHNFITQLTAKLGR